MRYNENLRKIREELNLTQKDFAERIGYNFRTVSNWELGFRVPSIFVIKKISKEFSISLDDLFDFDEE